jgi:ribosome maturation factor RimP
MATRIGAVDREIESRVEEMGFEFVEVEWGGGDDRPILRLRVDRPGSTKGDGITVDDCVRVSRALESWLDEASVLPERYTLEVSSPGVERPLIRRRDFERFAGQVVRVKAARAPEGMEAARFEAVLEGVAGEGGDADQGYELRLRVADGSTLVLPRSAVVRAQLVYQWDEEQD